MHKFVFPCNYLTLSNQVQTRSTFDSLPTVSSTWHSNSLQQCPRTIRHSHHFSTNQCSRHLNRLQHIIRAPDDNPRTCSFPHSNQFHYLERIALPCNDHASPRHPGKSGGAQGPDRLREEEGQQQLNSTIAGHYLSLISCIYNISFESWSYPATSLRNFFLLDAKKRRALHERTLNPSS